MTAPALPEFWAHKARALLLPTPFADSDPEGEDARIRAVQDLLATNHLGLTTWTEADRSLHQQAHADAYNAHTTLPPSTDSTPGLCHPLSGVKLTTPPALTVESWPLLLHILQERLRLSRSDEPRKSYQTLWRALMDPAAPLSLAHLPGHPQLNDHSILAHRSAAAALVGARIGGDQAALLHLHIGPVQGFINAARRTHDLSLGSYIVAYLSFHAVKVIADALGPDAILYPDLATLPLYEATLDPPPAEGENRRTRALRALRASLPNRFMALVPRAQAEQLAADAARAVFDTWSSIAQSVKNSLQIQARLRSEARFDDQISAHLEMDATIQAWTAEGPDDPVYARTFKAVREDLTAQRRLITEFPPNGAAIAKCTQCGEREQMGPDNDPKEATRAWNELREHLDRRFGSQAPDATGETIDLRDGEALCAVCLTKRFANRWYFGAKRAPLGLDWDNKDLDRLLLRFPSVASIASAPARYAIAQGPVDRSHWNQVLSDCHKALKFTPPGNLLPGLGGPQRTGQNHLDVDGTWYYDTSYSPDTARRDHDLLSKVSAESDQTVTSALARGRSALASMLAALARGADQTNLHITPYYAVISLDVDSMGKWLDGTHKKARLYSAFGLDIAGTRAITPALHREISRRQSQLASDPLYRIVEQDHLGRVIYSGGDDLLAFIPLATLFRCLSALQEAFCSDEVGLGREATVSAGVAISHWRSPLGQALLSAREAEHQAKQSGRDRLIITVDKRSGVPISATLAWGDPLKDFHDLTKVLADLSDDRPAEDTDAADPQSRADNPLKIRLNTLDRFERELDALLPTDPDSTPLPVPALRARLFLHLTGRRPSPFSPHTPLLRQLDQIASSDAAPRHKRQQLLAFLHLLRFLAREHDPVIAAALPTLSPPKAR